MGTAPFDFSLAPVRSWLGERLASGCGVGRDLVGIGCYVARELAAGRLRWLRRRLGQTRNAP